MLIEDTDAYFDQLNIFICSFVTRNPIVQWRAYYCQLESFIAVNILLIMWRNQEIIQNFTDLIYKQMYHLLFPGNMYLTPHISYA